MTSASAPDRRARATSDAADGSQDRAHEVFLSRARRALEATGHVWTQHRAVLIQVLRRAERPLSEDELLERGREQLPGLGRATVRKTLTLLQEHGLLRGWDVSGHTRVPPFGQAAARTSQGDAARLVCRACGEAVEVSSRAVPLLLRDLQRTYGYHFVGARLELAATCGTCHTRGAQRAYAT